MDYLDVRQYLLGKPDVTGDYPFGPDVLVPRIGGKMFATLGMVRRGKSRGAAELNLKCDPDEALALRDIFDSVRPGYHMNKRHWNTVVVDGSVPAEEIRRMIDNSYSLVVKGLRKDQRKSLELRYSPEELYG